MAIFLCVHYIVIFCMGKNVWQFFVWQFFVWYFFVWYFFVWEKTLTFFVWQFFCMVFFLVFDPSFSLFIHPLVLPLFVRHHPTLSPSLDRAGSITLGSCKKKIYVTKKKQIAAQQFRVWSPTTLLGIALSSLTTVDRTGNGAFCQIWPQPKK